MKTAVQKKFIPKFVNAEDSLLRLKRNRPDLFTALKNPSPRACLAVHLLELRRRKGMTQKELADKAGVGFRTLQRIEDAQPTSNPTMDVVESLAKAVGAGLSDLFKPVELIKIR